MDMVEYIVQEDGEHATEGSSDRNGDGRPIPKKDQVQVSEVG